MPFLKIEELDGRQMLPGFLAKMVHMKSMTFSHWTIDKGAKLPLHSHAHEQISILVEGKIGFTLDGQYQVVSPGMVVIIPGNVEHSGVAIEDCVIIDVFSPVREDYL